MSDSDTEAQATEAAERPWHKRHIWQIQFVRDLLFILAVWGLLSLGYVLQAVTVPLLVGLGLAYLFEPVIGRLSKTHSVFTRTRVVVGLLVSLLLLGLLAAALLLPMAARQSVNLARNAGHYLEQGLGLLESEHVPAFLRDELAHFKRDFALDGESAPSESTESPVEDRGAPAAAEPRDSAPLDAEGDQTLTRAEIEGMIAARLAERDARDQQAGTGTGASAGDVIGTLGNAAQRIGAFLVQVGTGLVGLVMAVFLVGFFFVIFSTSYPKVVDFFDSLIPGKHRERTLDLIGRMDQAVSGFVRGRLVICFVLGALFAIGWTICGVPHALVLGAVVGIATLVPYLSGLGLPIAWILLAVAVGDDVAAGGFYIDGEGESAAISWWKVLLFPGIVYLIAQLADDYLLSPVIQGRATNLSPAAIVVAVFAGGVLAGLYGMLLAIPIAACLRILISDLIWPRFTAWIRGERADPLPIQE